MKRSSQILLVLSGTLLAGCGKDESSTRPETGDYAGIADPADTNTYTNNTYQSGLGYYHSPYNRWFPLPYGQFRPGQGYYAGGRFQPTPPLSAVLTPPTSPSQATLKPNETIRGSQPAATATKRGGFGRSWFSGGS